MSGADDRLVPDAAAEAMAPAASAPAAADAALAGAVDTAGSHDGGPPGGGPLDARLAAAFSFERFEATARQAGFDEVLERRWQPSLALPTHAHPFALEVLVVQGEMWLSAGGRTRHIRAGQGFSLPAGVPHAERYGAAGAIFWVARRHPPAG